MSLLDRLARTVLLAALLVLGAACSSDESDATDAGTTEVCDKPCGKECCGANKKCDEKNLRCVTSCTPSCGFRECGSDLCGGSCGTCPAGKGCVNGECSDCVPDCRGRQCGPDGCGGLCGVCPGSTSCDEGAGLCGACERNCIGKECGSDGCGKNCGACPTGYECGLNAPPGRCGR